MATWLAPEQFQSSFRAVSERFQSGFRAGSISHICDSSRFYMDETFKEINPERSWNIFDFWGLPAVAEPMVNDPAIENAQKAPPTSSSSAHLLLLLLLLLLLRIESKLVPPFAAGRPHLHKIRNQFNYCNSKVNSPELNLTIRVTAKSS